MKILKSGKLPKPGYSLKGECHNCHCIILCTPFEVEYEEDRGRDDPVTKCPTLGCNTKIYLKDEK